VSFRPYAAAVAALATAAATLAVGAPAHASGTSPVTNLVVTQSQVGHNDVVHASWTPNDTATSYHVYISDQSDGSTQLINTDVTGNSADISTSTLTAGTTYYVDVHANVSGSLDTVTGFQAITLDTTGPTGTFHLNRTSSYMTLNFIDAVLHPSARPTASFVITQDTLGDDSTPASSVTRTVNNGHGTIKTWSVGQLFTISYTDAGTYTPTVTLTDVYGNQTVVELPTVHVYSDTTAPVVRIKPPTTYPYRVSSWRYIRGVASDGNSGVQVVLAFVAERRRGIWYTYDFTSRRWLRGYANLTRTLNTSNADAALMHVSSAHTWHTPFIRNLLPGPLHVEAYAIDNANNYAQARSINRIIHW
jgi:hypothetical protein